MSLFFSTTTRGFYDDAIHASIPGDAQPITDMQRANLLAAQSAGKVIEADADGFPVAVDPPPPGPPQVVSRFQARAALHLAGLLPQVEALMADPATDPLARLAWTDAQEFRRTSPTLLAMAAALELDDAALDQLFVTAGGIEA
ncbi:MAG: hypothetical protein BroJett024_41740 [Alphaproteobacteria bacterium]|nr:MAG: hypothetical protein BroJett024_41740 [Alphaproteobacteria bacterium]